MEIRERESQRKKGGGERERERNSGGCNEDDSNSTGNMTIKSFEMCRQLGEFI